MLAKVKSEFQYAGAMYREGDLIELTDKEFALLIHNLKKTCRCAMKAKEEKSIRVTKEMKLSYKTK